MTGLAGTAAEINVASSEAFTSPDAYATLENVQARHRANSVWMANLTVINDMRQMETTNGAKLFPGLENNPMTLLGRRVWENSDMDGAWNTGATANNYIVTVGNFGEGY